jgi:hypothetical protein
MPRPCTTTPRKCRLSRALKDDTDLDGRLATVEVGTLAPGAVETALDAGLAAARRMLRAGLVHGAVPWLQGRHRTCLP